MDSEDSTWRLFPDQDIPAIRDESANSFMHSHYTNEDVSQLWQPHLSSPKSPTFEEGLEWIDNFYPDAFRTPQPSGDDGPSRLPLQPSGNPITDNDLPETYTRKGGEPTSPRSDGDQGFLYETRDNATVAVGLNEANLQGTDTDIVMVDARAPSSSAEAMTSRMHIYEQGAAMSRLSDSGAGVIGVTPEFTAARGPLQHLQSLVAGGLSGNSLQAVNSENLDCSLPEKLSQPLITAVHNTDRAQQRQEQSIPRGLNDAGRNADVIPVKMGTSNPTPTSEATSQSFIALEPPITELSSDMARKAKNDKPLDPDYASWVLSLTPEQIEGLKKPQIDEILRNVKKPWPGANKQGVVRHLRLWQDEERARRAMLPDHLFPELPSDPRVLRVLQNAFDRSLRATLALPPRPVMEARSKLPQDAAGSDQDMKAIKIEESADTESQGIGNKLFDIGGSLKEEDDAIIGELSLGKHLAEASPSGMGERLAEDNKSMERKQKLEAQEAARIHPLADVVKSAEDEKPDVQAMDAEHEATAGNRNCSTTPEGDSTAAGDEDEGLQPQLEAVTGYKRKASSLVVAGSPIGAKRTKLARAAKTKPATMPHANALKQAKKVSAAEVAGKTGVSKPPQKTNATKAGGTKAGGTKAGGTKAGSTKANDSVAGGTTRNGGKTGGQKGKKK